MNALSANFIRLILKTVVATVIGLGVSSTSLAAAPSCELLFSEQAPYSETRFSFLPEYVRFVRKSAENYVADYIYTIKGLPRLKKTEIAMDSANVIDANLNSGRELLNAILNKKSQAHEGGTFIFIDVNNLGWVNKNFHDKTQAGDSYLFKTVTAIQKVIGHEGLIFRLGGDEFGIVIETQDPHKIQKIMSSLQDEIHRQAHSVFRRETQYRAAAFRQIHQRYKKDELSEADYQIALAEFKNYISYSQESVSMGASLIDGSSAETIQNRAENMATEMKIKIKKAFNLDTSKYTGGVNLSDTEHKIEVKFRPAIPLVQTLPRPISLPLTRSDSTYVKTRQVLFATVPVIKSERTEEVFKYGQLRIGKYKNELTADEYRFERYDINDTLIESRPLEVNTNTRLIDARSQAAKAVINQVMLANDPAVGPSGQGVVISLLNLGKLNYFHKKTATGDLALRLAAEAIRSEISRGQVPFKFNGSDFFVLTVGMTKEEITNYKKDLELKLNANIDLNQVFLSEISYIEATEKDASMREKRIDEVRKLMIKKFQIQ